MMNQREVWLNSTREDPSDPDLPICDPHHHLWDHPDDIPEDRLRESHRHVRHNLLKELLEDIGESAQPMLKNNCRMRYPSGRL
jgi:hypothetical protein